MKYFLKNNEAEQIAGPLTVEEINQMLIDSKISGKWLATGDFGEHLKKVQKQSPSDWFQLSKLAGVDRALALQAEARSFARLENGVPLEKESPSGFRTIANSVPWLPWVAAAVALFLFNYYSGVIDRDKAIGSGVLGVIFSFVVGSLAKRKNLDYWPWWFFGFALSLVALVSLAFKSHKCPRCRQELVEIDAKNRKCPDCGPW